MIQFTVYGTPIQKGSARAFYIEKLKRAVVTSDTRRGLKEWDRSIRDAAQKYAGTLMLGPVHVSLSFVMPRPKSLPKRAQHHTKKPDIDKLSRTVLDALTGIIWKDDSQVITLTARKGYTFDPSDTPCVHISITEEQVGAPSLLASA